MSESGTNTTRHLTLWTEVELCFSAILIEKKTLTQTRPEILETTGWASLIRRRGVNGKTDYIKEHGI